MSELNQLFREIRQVREEADCLYTKDEMLLEISKLAQLITDELSETNPIVVGIMNGGLIPMGLLVSELDFPLQIDYLHATRYRDKTNGGELQWLASPKIPMHDRTILLVDDIHDEGITLEAIKAYCKKEGAKKVYSAVLVNKIHDRKNNTGADFVALEIPDRYVFGFGMDYKGLLRNAPGIYAVKGL
ncbi:MAG: hypoxanthine-guanine phosphoribosyltransferase [gamma proteobacterium symbiont of Bathyaustriella thionipta]|nr:hypoxanthine-guanine phosphoribosyltransferase [gamma proteobacterium symbiont of Bathyaustriella thionipta]MCU7949848.1 hypoxanthine-guanine phosphoribosyltransferase [gamma proteobacterium symbiont of Bathyaustriella thionipta]MCU7954606.1 hypoxanthine-guanine phosphoribosyltransferase [gamma proteobacterium symbiont of Bathyaustriella thionipta]MCU7956539.1 hypoxanthine-guanine phosphoribosyltransferase [gamma proteobacterium symbiont of Bathyaustriella thionipta]MCU7966945.1 hypoxanthine